MVLFALVSGTGEVVGRAAGADERKLIVLVMVCRVLLLLLLLLLLIELLMVVIGEWRDGICLVGLWLLLEALE